MNAFFANALRQVREFLSRLTPKDKIRLVILGVLIIAFSIALAVILGRVNYATLYSGLSNAEGGQVIAALDEMGVSYKTQGNSVLVPAENVDELRMRLESAGIQGGEPSTSFIDRTLGFGVTAEDRATYTLMQKQSDLRAYIKNMEKIEECFVTLNIPADSMFAKAQPTAASASVLISVKDGLILTPAEAYTIGAYVMGAVPGLLPENVYIADTKMNLYPLILEEEPAEEDENPGEPATLDYQYALRERVRKDMETQVTNLLSPVFGNGHVRVNVSVALNFDKQTISSIEFAPPVEGETSGIVISMQELYESSRTTPEEDMGPPGTDSNGLGDPEYPYNTTLDEDEIYSKVLREINYEINETRTEIERAQGTIRDLSIAVVLDANTLEDDYTANVRDLVAQAVGVSSRYVSVQRLPFQMEAEEVTQALESQEAYLRSMQSRELIKTAIVALAVVFLAFLVFSFIKTILRTFAPPPPVLALASADFGEIDISMPEVGVGVGVGSTVDYLTTEDDDMFIEEPEEDMGPELPINIKPEAVEQLEKFIDRDPQAVAQLLRNWLSDEYR